MELGQHHLEYRPRSFIKGQVLADSVVEVTDVTNELVTGESSSLPIWNLYVDGSSNNKRLGAGIILVTPKQIQLKSTIKFGFRASSNESEYEALLA